MFAVYRLGAAVPVPGVDLDAVQRLTESGAQAGIYGLLNLFSGGALETFSVFALGIMPYITSSIILQLLTVVIPRLQKLQEEGESGEKSDNTVDSLRNSCISFVTVYRINLYFF